MTKERRCQEWDLNPRPFGPAPEAGALDQLGHLDFDAKDLKLIYIYVNQVLIYSYITGFWMEPLVWFLRFQAQLD